MYQRKFGRTGLNISELCLGAMQFGWRSNEENSFALLDAYRAAGGNFIQTTTCSPLGVDGPALCHSETIVGSWLRQHPGARTNLLLSTRLRFSRNTAGGLAEMVRRQCEASLRRLHTTHLDLLVCEWSDAFLPLDDVFSAFDDLVRAGKLRYVGAVGFPVWRFMESLGQSARRGCCRFESFQADYSLLQRSSFEPDAFDLAREQRVALLAQSPLAGGFLTGLYQGTQLPDTARTRRLSDRYGNARGHAVLNTLTEIGEELQATCAQVALAWVLAREGVTAALISFPTPEHVHEMAAASRLNLSGEHLRRLELSAQRVGASGNRLTPTLQS